MGPPCMNVTLLFKAIISIALGKNIYNKAPSQTGCIFRALFQMPCSDNSETCERKESKPLQQKQ